ncbi:MAG: acyltransferase [Aeromicrobium sp.]
MSRFGRAWRLFGVVFFNSIGTYIPFHTVRIGLLRIWGAKIGKDCSILRGSTVLDPDKLIIGDECSIGFRCLLDARGGLTIGNRVVVASDTQFIAGEHLVNTSDFRYVLKPILVEDYVWLASRVTVLCGVTIGYGAVAAACALVRKDVGSMEIVAGVPAKVVGKREAELDYSPVFRPWGY